MSEEKMEWREIWKELIATSKKAVLAPNKSGLVYFDALPFQDDKMLLFEKAISYELLGMKNEAIEFYTKAADIKEGLPVEHWRKRANYFLTRIKTQGICQTHEINLSSDLYTIQWNVFFNAHSFVFLDDYIRYLAISSISRIYTEPAMAVIIFRTCLEVGLWIHYEEVVKKLDELNFYKKQKRIALQNCGVIDPEEIDEYIAFDGYKALEKVLTSMSQDDVINEITESGLRGRGGAGFPTGKKWFFTKIAEGDKKYVVCNADEGDPGAFMDRSILEGDPHSIIEAMMIAGYAIGADKGYIYVRAEYPIAVHRFQTAIDQAKEYGILGNNIFGTNFNFDLSIRLGAGAFVCGEETALLESIEGRSGRPRLKPPFPANVGLWGKPTLINNVETYANITKIILNGAKWYNSIGTETSKGTKVFALGGNVVNVGLVEVPMGTTLREIVFDIGGGIPNGRKFKAAQTGGPSGGCIPEEHLDTPIDYESLSAIGSMMGSGGLIVMDDTKCMVNLAKFYLGFTVDESCGKCTPCRIGTKRLLEILEKITEGNGTLEDLDKLEKLANSQIAAKQSCDETLKGNREHVHKIVSEVFFGLTTCGISYIPKIIGSKKNIAQLENKETK